MKNIKSILFISIALVYTPAQVLATPAVNPYLGSDLAKLAVFAHTYTSTGANSIVWGSTSSGDVATTGANSRVSGDMSSVNASNVGGDTAVGAKVGGNLNSGGVTTLGDSAVVGGNIKSSGAATTGANAKVVGNLDAGGVTTTGDSAKVGGSIQSGGATTIGAHSTVTGNVASVGALAVSADGGSVGSWSSLASTPVDSIWKDTLASAESRDAKLTADTQTYLTAFGLGTALSTTMTTDTTLSAGVYSAANLSTTAGTTLTLDGQGLDNQTWIFNITDYLVTGASSTIKLINAGVGSSVFWNTGGYASLGASSLFQGNIFAKTYISVGANTQVTGVGTSCGGVYSATSYVSTGDTSVIGGVGCTASEVAASAAPEPAVLSLVLTGLACIGLSSRRRKLLLPKGLAA